MQCYPVSSDSSLRLSSEGQTDNCFRFKKEKTEWQESSMSIFSFCETAQEKLTVLERIFSSTSRDYMITITEVRPSQKVQIKLIVNC